MSRFEELLDKYGRAVFDECEAERRDAPFATLRIDEAARCGRPPFVGDHQ